MENHTIIKALKWAEDIFIKHNIENPRLDAEVLLAYVLQIRRLYLYVHFNQELTDQQIDEYKNLVHRRLEHIPVAHLVGTKSFMGMDLAITSDVLVPRPETEILAQEVIDRLNRIEGAVKIADIGTGSGAIAIAILRFIDHVTAEAVDISERAIEIANLNAMEYNVSDRIDFHVGDLLEPLSGKKFNAIISNPPYIPNDVIDTLQPEVAIHEPRLALEGGADGLDFYRRLISDSPDLIADDGFLALEIGIDQSGPVKQMLELNDRFDKIEIKKDLANIDRVIIAWKNNAD